jgi:hypothetical protein
MNAQSELFDAPDPRHERLRALMLAELRKPWPGPPAIAEPSDGDKVAFAEAFLVVSQPSVPSNG